MNRQVSGDFFDHMNLKSQKYAENATLLSNRIEEIEALLQQTTGKVEVTVYCNEGSLAFCRVGDDWRLWFEYLQSEHEDPHPGEVVTESSVAVKSLAAKMLPELLERLSSELSSKLDQVSEGLNALDQIKFRHRPTLKKRTLKTEQPKEKSSPQNSPFGEEGDDEEVPF